VSRFCLYELKAMARRVIQTAAREL